MRNLSPSWLTDQSSSAASRLLVGIEFGVEFDVDNIGEYGGGCHNAGECHKVDEGSLVITCLELLPESIGHGVGINNNGSAELHQQCFVHVGSDGFRLES